MNGHPPYNSHVLVSLLCLLALLAPARVGATDIYETVPLGRDICELTILSSDLVLCLGDTLRVAAEVDCESGYLLVHAPAWRLGDLSLGEGFEITAVPGVGDFALIAACASCADTIMVTVLDDPYCTETPRLNAAHCDDRFEADPGIFMRPNPGPIFPQTFGMLKYLMHPFTLEAHESLTEGEFRLEQVGGSNLALYTPSGTPISLPATYDVATLPLSFLVNATAVGRATLVATNISRGREAGVDEVAVRVGGFPGLGGRALAQYPQFEFVTSFNDNEIVQTAIDPFRHAERVGLPYRVYVVAHKTRAQWAANSTLIDVTGGFETRTVLPGSIADNITNASASGLPAGIDFGLPYDVIFDFGLDGTLDPGDLIDGFDDTVAGFYSVRDLNLAGPYSTATVTYTGGSWLGQRCYYPTSIATLGRVPLVVISHGNGHQYTWYDYLGEHLASYGYVVMSHQNDTGPGVENASITTLTNTDYFLGHLTTIAGGILDGHIADDRIVWIGHSRGGEGVVRAYDRLYDHTYTPANFDANDIVLISSIAPTVFLGTVSTNSHEVDYHMIYGSADGDVHGGASNPIAQAIRLCQAAQGNAQLTYVQGASHNDFNCCGTADGTGPDLIGRPEAQRVAKSYYLALLKLYLENNVAAKDYFTRMYSRFHPSGIASNVVCALYYKEALATPRFVIDNLQTQTGLGISSSGGMVSYDVSNANEGTLDDGNTSFTWTASDPMNGMTWASGGDAYAGGVVFDWTVGESKHFEYEVIAGERDFTDDLYLAFRSCQGTRHPETVALGSALSYTVTLRDGSGATSAINFGAYGTLTRPYLRTGEGTGAGWANEFNTVRIRLTDFEANGSGIDLSNIVAVRFEFGAAYGSARGRVGIDDVELSKN